MGSANIIGDSGLTLVVLIYFYYVFWNDVLVNAGLRLKCKNLKDNSISLYDNRGLCFQVLSHPEYLGTISS